MAFVKKLMEQVEKASRKQVGGGTINSLRSEEVNPVLSFHYGIPLDSSILAYNPIQQIIAIATRNGQIKLFGRDNTQALLQSENAGPAMFLQFMDNQGILLNVNSQNQIEVWDTESRQLLHMHAFNIDITSFTILQQSLYIYVGDRNGEVSVLKFDPTQKKLLEMPYQIPFSKSYGEGAREIPVRNILLQPMAESRRVLMVFEDGLLVLWDLQSSEVVFSAGKGTQLSSQNESKTVTSACWACTHGSKVVIGYSSGDVYLWSIPVLSTENCSSEKRKSDASSTQNPPLLKLNLGFKMDKVPIVSLRWVSGDSKTNRLYVNGFRDDPLYHSFQVIILNEATESRTIKLVLPLTEPCISAEHIFLSGGKNRHKLNTLALLLKSGHLYLFDDLDIERYLVHSQSKSPPTLPRHIVASLPSFNSPVTSAKLYTSNGPILSVEDYSVVANKYPQFLSTNAKQRETINVGCTSSGNLSKTKSLYITGHLDGTINFWDASCPLLVLILSLKQQTGDTNASSVSPITSLHFDASSKVLISGDQAGQVRIITFKKDASENIFSFLQAKPGENYTIRGLKLPGAIGCISRNCDSKHLAVGTNKGLVVLVHIEEASIVYQKQIQGQVASGIISMQFKKFVLEGFEKNLLLVATEDSSILAIEEETGNALSPNIVHTKNPSRALLMQIIEEEQCFSEHQNVSTGNSFRETASKNDLLLLCSENAVRVFSSSHAIQGIKKQIIKKRLGSNCCYASIIRSLSNGIGLLLVFTSGKIEIRSFPDLNLLKESSLRSFKFSKNPNSYTSLSASSDGELIVVNGNQEISFFTTLGQKDSYRYVEDLSAVYRKDISQQEESSYTINSPKEKKMGLFGKVMKDLKGSKAKNNDEIGTEYCSARDFEQLSLILETANFPVAQERRNSSEKEEVELSIDDIEIEDAHEEESKDKNKAQQFTAFSKQRLGKGLQALKGKLKPKTDDKVSPGKIKVEDREPVSSVDQIKSKYGYSTNDEMSAAKMAENKLRDNVKKLEDINVRSAEMANSAQTFSSMANELLKTIKNEKS
ncbi:transducin/WD40 repeat-like superfamily protein [Carex rostrata]